MGNKKSTIVERVFLQFFNFGSKVLNLSYFYIEAFCGFAERFSVADNVVDSRKSNIFHRIVTSIVIALVYCIIIFVGGSSLFGLTMMLIACIAMGEIFNASLKIASIEKQRKFRVLGLFWVFTTFGSITAIRLLSAQGFALTFWMVSTIVTVDSVAYLTGKFFGKAKILPHVSPSKTFIGAFGGSVAGILVSSFCFYGFSNGIGMGNTAIGEVLWVVAVSFVIVLFAQVGDAIQSKIKRDIGIKEIGFIVIGHGGVLDRFDSFMLVAPILLIMALINGGLVF